MLKAVNKIKGKNKETEKKVALFTAHHEAFIVTQYANNVDRWTARFEYFTREGIDVIAGKLPSRVPKQNGAKVPDPIHDARFSVNDAGQERFETYSEEGLKFFLKIFGNIRKARAKRDVLIDMNFFEHAFLKHLQEKYAKELEKNSQAAGKKRRLGEEQVLKKAKRKSLQSMAADDDDEELLDIEEIGDDDTTLDPAAHADGDGDGDE